MIFNSLDFLLFFLLVYLVYLHVDRKRQNWLLLGASYFFYGYWDFKFLSLLLLSTVIDFVAAVKIEDSATERARKMYLWMGVLGNLAILGTFKYYNFFATSFSEGMASFGVTVSWHFLDIVLPVGVSFYTFQSMSYTIDVYRRKLPATKSFMDFALFVTFFPQLVAGPIERAKKLLSQVQSSRTIRYEDIKAGAWFLLLGFFKKTVVADNMAPFVRAVFDSPESAQGAEILLANYAAFFMIYADFSGYSDIAKGSAKLMGFHLTDNFRVPYFATNPGQFWRRWHITLSNWFLDYVYIPLTRLKWMQKTGAARRPIAVLITFCLVGLWHGAAWNFVIWGLLNGVLVVLYAAGAKIAPKIKFRGDNILKALVFFHLWWFVGFFFVARKASDVPILWGKVFSPWVWNGDLALYTIIIFAGPMVFLDLCQRRNDDPLFIKQWPRMARLACYAVLLLMVFLSGETGSNEFIYFQF